MAELCGSWQNRSKRTPRDPSGSQGFGGTNVVPDVFSALNSVTSKLTERHRDIIRSTGFGSFANIIHQIHFDEQFLEWLGGKTETSTRSIRIDETNKLFMFPEDVQTILGIPCVGKPVWDGDSSISGSAYNSVMKMIGRMPADENPTVAAERVVLAFLEFKDKPDVDTFKVAYVIYVLGFTVGSTHVHFWPALVDPHKISQYNWADCLLRTLFEGTGSATPPGCKILLQVLTSLYIFSSCGWP